MFRPPKKQLTRTSRPSNPNPRLETQNPLFGIPLGLFGGVCGSGERWHSLELCTRRCLRVIEPVCPLGAFL